MAVPGAKPYTLSILVMPAQTNTLGVMHGGHMMSWMDMAAWVVAARALEPDQRPFFKAVTDCVWSAPVYPGEVCSVTARLEEVGTSSLTIALDAEAEDPIEKVTRHVCRATFTMVAADSQGKAEPVRLARRRRTRR